MAVQDVVDNLQSKALSLPGIKFAPDAPPESTSVYPFAVTYPRTGTDLGGSAGFSNVQRALWTEFHVSRQLLPSATKSAIAIIELFEKLLIGDPKLGDTVQTIVGYSWTFGRLSWADVETIGVRFEITYKDTLVV